MLKMLELLKSSEVVKSHELLDFKHGKGFNFLKVKALLVDNSQLYVREYVSEGERIYSYHWQDADGKLRIRWDNAPHRPEMKTFPHHKHTPEVEESEEISIEDVLRVISNKMKK